MTTNTASNILSQEDLVALTGGEEPETVSLNELLERGAAYGLQIDDLIDPNHTSIDHFAPSIAAYRDPFELCCLLEAQVGAPLATTQY